MGSPGKGDRVRVGVGVGVEGSPEEGAMGSRSPAGEGVWV